MSRYLHVESYLWITHGQGQKSFPHNFQPFSNARKHSANVAVSHCMFYCSFAYSAPLTSVHVPGYNIPFALSLVPILLLTFPLASMMSHVSLAATALVGPSLLQALSCICIPFLVFLASMFITCFLLSSPLVETQFCIFFPTCNPILVCSCFNA